MRDGMPDVGVPSTPPPVAVTHTSTEQWQSFEIRMRHRRAERCVLRAEVALEAGFEEDARAALDEARRLNSQTPDLDTLRAAVNDRIALRAAERRAMQRRRAGRLAAAAVLMLAVGVGAFWARRAAPPLATTASAPVRTTAAAAALLPAALTDRPAPPPVATAGRVETAANRDDRATEPPSDARAPAAETGTPPIADLEPVAAAPPANFSPANLEPAALHVTPAPALPDPLTLRTAEHPPTVPIERLVASLPTTELPRAGNEPPPEATPVDQEPRVRAVLARYESAYSGLDASAAQAVWPAVDGRSLARAFETLASQRVSLGRCSVSIEGLRARADCSGSVTWTPKVGGGAQTEPRRWRFELVNANGAWWITQAEVR